MALTAGEIIWKINGDKSGLDKATKSAEKQATGLGGKFKQVGKLIAGAFAVKAIFSFTKSLVRLGSEAQGISSKFGTTFRGITNEANTMARALSENYGLGVVESKKLLANTGDLLTGFGMQREAALGLSNEVQMLAADLAAFSGGQVSTQFASEALTKGLFGETEQMKTLGIVVNQNDKNFQELVKTKQRDEGLTLQQAKAMAILETATSQSGNAIGAYSREADKWVNVQKRISNLLKDTSADIGQKLLPGLENLGLAFLGAAKDGSFLNEALTEVALGVSKALSGFALLITKVRQWKAEFEQNDIFEQQKKVTKGIKETREELVKLGFTKDEIDQKGTTRFLSEEENAKLKEYIGLQNQQTVLIEKNKAAQDDQASIQDLLNKINEKGNQTLQDNIAAREKERAAQKGAIDNNKKEAKTIEDKRTELEKYIEELNKVSSVYSSGFGEVENLFSAIGDLSSGIAESRIADLDREMEKELEAAGLLEETKEQQLQADIERAQMAGDVETENEKKKQLERLKIEEKFQKKKAMIEYQAALMNWQFQLAVAIAQLPLMIMQAMSSGWAVPIAGVVLGPLYGAIAGAAGALQVAAVVASKPKTPSFQGGGFVPGNQFAGDQVAAQVNSGELILNNAQQSRLFDIADGRSQPGGGGNIMIYIGDNLIYESMYEATKTGDLIIDERAVVSV